MSEYDSIMEASDAMLSQFRKVAWSDEMDDMDCDVCTTQTFTYCDIHFGDGESARMVHSWNVSLFECEDDGTQEDILSRMDRLYGSEMEWQDWIMEMSAIMIEAIAIGGGTESDLGDKIDLDVYELCKEHGIGFKERLEDGISVIVPFRHVGHNDYGSVIFYYDDIESADEGDIDFDMMDEIARLDREIPRKLVRAIVGNCCTK